MESKKTPEADLRQYRNLIFGISLLLTMSFVTTAFNWRSEGEKINIPEPSEDIFDLPVEIPPTEIPQPPKPVKAPPILIEAPTDEEIIKEVDIDIDAELNEKSPDIKIMPIEIVSEKTEDKVFVFVENSAEPEGGMEAFLRDIAKKVKYPAQARRMQIEGRVYLEFVVNKDGSLSELKVIKGIGAGCDEEALRAFQTTSRWKPGKQRGVPVRQKMVLPIVFKLD